MPFETYLLYLSAVAVFFATPPDTSQLLIIANSARYGLRRSVFTIAGDLTANCIQMTAAAFGLAAAIAASAAAFQVIKWLGVAYLLYLGVTLLISRSGPATAAAAEAGAPRRLFRQGFVTSLANPFAVVFFGALFPQFIDPSSAIWPQLLILGATYLVVDGAILLLWGRLGAVAAARLSGGSWTRVNRVCGALMIAAAGLLAIKDMEPRAKAG